MLQSHSHMSDKVSWHVQVFLTSRYLAIAMEYVAGGDMFEYVVRKGGLKESEARWFFQQLIIGVDYLHRMVHSCPIPALLPVSHERATSLHIRPCDTIAGASMASSCSKRAQC